MKTFDKIDCQLYIFADIIYNGQDSTLFSDSIQSLGFIYKNCVGDERLNKFHFFVKTHWMFWCLYKRNLIEVFFYNVYVCKEWRIYWIIIHE